MKTKLAVSLCVAAVLPFGSPVRASSDDAGAVAVDVILVRPVSLVSTIACGALFVVALPIAAISNSVKPTKEALLVAPARYTFARPVGDFGSGYTLEWRQNKWHSE